MPLTITSLITNKRLIFLLKALLLGALGGVIYVRVLHGPFLFDDIYYIVRNPAIKHLERLDTIFKGNVSPLRFLPFYSFALNYHYHQLHVYGYHLVNIVIHILNAFLVWRLAFVTIDSPKIKNRAQNAQPHFLAYIIALIFLVHPVQTQAVSYITQRFALMATFFYLLSMVAYAQYRRGDARWIAVCLLSAVGALFSKQIALTLPFIILIYDRLFYPSDKKGMALTLLASVALLSVIPAFYAFDAANVLSITQPSKSHIGDTLNSANYFLTQPRVITQYLSVIVFPFFQNFIYDFSVSRSMFEPRTLLAYLFIAGLLCWAHVLVGKDRLAAFGLLWFFITLSVESGLIAIGHVIFEHRVYLPSFGIFLAAVVLINRLAGSQKRSIIIFSCLVALFSALSFMRNKIYTDTIVFWEDTLKKSPGHPLPYLNLGEALFEKQRYGEAMENFNKALLLQPDNADTYNNRGLLQMQQGQGDKAMEDLNKAIAINANHLNAHHNLGVLYLKMNKPREALKEFDRSLQINLSHAESYIERAGIYFGMRRFDEALADYTKAILYDPANIKALNNKGAVYNTLKEYDIAARYFKEAVFFDGDFAPAHYNLSFAEYQRGDKAKAKFHLEKAIALGYDVDKKFAAMVLQEK